MSKDQPFDYAAHCATYWERCACELMFPSVRPPRKADDEFVEDDWWTTESNRGGACGGSWR